MNRHPQNSVRVHFVKRIFPEARLVHIVRDGRAVVCSCYRSVQNKPGRQIPFAGYIRPRGWRSRVDQEPVDQLSFMWNQTVMYASTAIREHADDFLELRYEDLTEHYEELIGKIWELAGLETSSELLQRLPAFANQNSKWQTELTPAHISKIENLAQEGLTRFEYL